jgi:hypothetical protein
MSKSDEEFVLFKTKRRRVVATTGLFHNSFIQVASVYTLKEYHGKNFNLDDLRNQQLPGIIYLEVSDINKESFMSLPESFPIYKDFLEPRNLGLNAKGMSLLDEHLILIHDLFTESG